MVPNYQTCLAISQKFLIAKVNQRIHLRSFSWEFFHETVSISVRLKNRMHSDYFVQRAGARVTFGDDTAEIKFQVRNDFFQAAKAMHGDLYFLALDNAAFFAVQSLVDDVFVLTVTFTTYMTRPVSEGALRSVGKVVHKGKTQFIAESILYDSEDREIGRASGVFTRGKTPLTPDIGYL